MKGNTIGIGVNAWVWTSPFSAASCDLIAKAHGMGFDAFTVPIEDPALIDVAAIKKQLEKTPLRLNVSGAYGPDRDLTSDDPALRKNALAYIRESLEICQALGVTVMGGPAYSAVGKRRQVPGAQRQREWERAVVGLTEAGTMAADYGVTLAIEPLNRFETDLINTAAQVKRLIQAIDLPSVKIHLDSFHMHIEEQSLYEAIVLAGKDLVYFDASESHRGTPGDGQVHWDEVARALEDIGYSGDCVIESFTPECVTIADAAAIWRPLAPSQDALAAEGCRFLKQLLTPDGR